MVACDGVILTGDFQPETALLSGTQSNLILVGNVSGAVNTAGTCVVQARAAAERIAKDLQ
jgi:hypothetical protein